MTKNLIFGPDLGLLGQNWASKKLFFIFFSKIWLHESLDITISYHHVQYLKELMIES